MRSKLLLLVFIFTFSAEAQDNGAKMNTKEIKLLVDSLSAALKRWYIYPDKAELISKSVKENFKSGAYNKLQNRSELANMIHNDIQKVHHDGHMRIMYSPRI